MKQNQFIAELFIVLGSIQVSLAESRETEQLSGNWWNYDSYSMQAETGPITLTQTSPTRLDFFDEEKTPVGHAIKSFGSSVIYLHSSDGLRTGVLSQKKNDLLGKYLSYQNSAGTEIAQGFKERTSNGTLYRYMSTDPDSTEILTLEHFADQKKHRFSVTTHKNSGLDEKLIISRAVFDVLSARRKKTGIIGSISAVISLVVIGSLSNTHMVEVNDGSTDEILRKSRERLEKSNQDCIKISRGKIKKFKADLATNKTERDQVEKLLKPAQLQEKVTRAAYDQAKKDLADAVKKKDAIKPGPFGRKVDPMSLALMTFGGANPTDIAAQFIAEKAIDDAEKAQKDAEGKQKKASDDWLKAHSQYVPLESKMAGLDSMHDFLTKDLADEEASLKSRESPNS